MRTITLEETPEKEYLYVTAWNEEKAEVVDTILIDEIEVSTKPFLCLDPSFLEMFEAGTENEYDFISYKNIEYKTSNSIYYKEVKEDDIVFAYSAKDDFVGMVVYADQHYTIAASVKTQFGLGNIYKTLDAMIEKALELGLVLKVIEK